MKTLNQQEQGDFLDRVMDGFLMPLNVSANDQTGKGEVCMVCIRRMNAMKVEFTFRSVQCGRRDSAGGQWRQRELLRGGRLEWPRYWASAA